MYTQAYIKFMKHGTLMLKYKKGVPTLRWLQLSKDMTKLVWRKPTHNEKKYGTSGSIPSFNKSQSMPLESIVAVYYGPNEQDDFMKYIEINCEPWLCFTIDFGRDVFFNLACRSVTIALITLITLITFPFLSLK